MGLWGLGLWVSGFLRLSGLLSVFEGFRALELQGLGFRAGGFTVFRAWGLGVGVKGFVITRTQNTEMWVRQGSNT